MQKILKGYLLSPDMGVLVAHHDVLLITSMDKIQHSVLQPSTTHNLLKVWTDTYTPMALPELVLAKKKTRSILAPQREENSHRFPMGLGPSKKIRLTSILEGRERCPLPESN